MFTPRYGFESEAEFEAFLKEVLLQVHALLPSFASQVINALLQSMRQSLLVEKADGLSLRQVALFHVYSGKVISANNANRIANEYGHACGSKLRTHYICREKSINRTGVQGREVGRFLGDLRAIKPYLDKEAIDWVEKEERQIELRK